MNSTLVMQMRAWLLRPMVVHRLPGRLRLRIPALKRLRREQRDSAMLWRDLLLDPPEIESVDINITTGSMLICYDADAIREVEVLTFLKSVNRFVLRHWERLAATPPGELANVLQRLQRAAKQALRQRPVLADDLVVPDDVWA